MCCFAQEPSGTSGSNMKFNLIKLPFFVGQKGHNVCSFIDFHLAPPLTAPESDLRACLPQLHSQLPFGIGDESG